MTFSIRTNLDYSINQHLVLALGHRDYLEEKEERSAFSIGNMMLMELKSFP